jgi:hypothetical protein
MLREEKQKGRPSKSGINIQTTSDDRTVLSLLPGKLLAKRQLEREIGEIRLIVRGGEHREWLALLPGLEAEVFSIDKTLQAMGGVLGSASSNGHQSEDGAEPPKPKQLPAAKGTANLGEVFSQGMLVYHGKPRSDAILLAALMKNGTISRKEFSAKWGSDFNTFNGTGFYQSIRSLAKQGVVVKRRGVDRYVLRTKITGEWPAELAEHPLMQKALGGSGHVEQVSPAETELPPVTEPVAAEPAAEAEAETPKFHPRHKFEGSWPQILVQEFHQAPDRTLDLEKLAKKYGTARYTFNFTFGPKKALNRYGYLVEKVAGRTGIFRLVKEGKGLI